MKNTGREATALRLAVALGLGVLLLAALDSPGPRSRSAPGVVPVSDGFDCPVGASAGVTAANDGDGYYCALGFGAGNHLGEDWNGEGGGDSDLGHPVYAASTGSVIYAGDPGPSRGWGRVVIIRHRLPDRSQAETLYGHLDQVHVRTGQSVRRRQQIGTMGNADGRYPAHLHFEVRTKTSLGVGPGYREETQGWTDPSAYIAGHRPPLPR